MRQYKFRAWDNQNKIFSFPEFNIIGEVTVFDLANQYQLEKLVKLEVSQSTEIKDKNGVEIYEGDIVEAILNIHGKESTLKFNAKVIYNSKIGSFQISYKNSNDNYVNDNIYSRYFLKVIGNIFENPQLL